MNSAADAAKPSILLWSLGGEGSSGSSPVLVSHIPDAATYGIVALAFSPDARLLVAVGSRHDRELLVFRLGPGAGPNSVAKIATGRLSQRVRALAFLSGSRGDTFVTAGERHLKFWDVSGLRDGGGGGGGPRWGEGPPGPQAL